MTIRTTTSTLKAGLLATVFLFLAACKTAPKAVEVPPGPPRLISAAVELMEVDRLDHIYVADKRGRLAKYDAAGNLKFEYFNRRLGPITSIDVSDPMQIVLFFKEQNTVRILDNTLNDIRTIDLGEKGDLPYVEAVCASNDGHLWIMDSRSRKFLKVDAGLNTLVETNTLEDLYLENISVIKMREAGNHLVALSDKKGFVVFDNFGQFTKLIPSQGALDFQFDGKGIIYQTITNYRYQKIRFEEFSFMSLPISVNSTEVLKAHKTTDGWVVAYPNGVDVLKL